MIRMISFIPDCLLHTALLDTARPQVSTVADEPVRRIRDQRNKLAVDRRRYCQLSSTDDGPVYHAKRLPLSS